MFLTYCALHFPEHTMHTEHVIQCRQNQLSLPSNKSQQKHSPAAGECHGCLFGLHDNHLGWALENMPLVTHTGLMLERRDLPCAYLAHHEPETMTIIVIIVGVMPVRHCRHIV